MESDLANWLNRKIPCPSFSDDPLGRKMNFTLNGVQTDDQYDGNDIVAEIGGGAVQVTYLRGLSVDEPFVRQAETNEYFHVDALGTTLDLTDNTGAVTTNYEYKAFGKTTINGTSTNPFQYTGRENDGTGLYYYRGRYYSSELQRFISPDPSGSPIRPAMFIGGVPWVSSGSCTPLVITDPYRLQYVYVKDNPLNLTDPSGLAGTEACDYYDKQCEKRFPSKQRKDRNDSIFASQSYECQAGQCCRDFGEGNKKKDDIRGCLIKSDSRCSKIQDEVARKSCRRYAHYKCYSLSRQSGRFGDEPSSCGSLL